MNSAKPTPAPANPTERRSFLIRFMAVVLGALVALFPFAVGLGVLLDPIRRRRSNDADTADSNTPPFLRIGPLDVLPADGVPRPFAVTADVVDAWTHAPAQRIGLVFLAHTTTPTGPQVTAFTAACPHLGCAVEFNRGDSHFECPCHKSAFDVDGKKLYGPSLRGLDPLPVKLETAGDQTEIWVAFEKFRTGIAERIRVG